MESVATPSWEPYQVFINHRGKDTKLTLASLIYHALEPYGLRVFLDQYVLCPGDTIETEIRGAISSSSVHIAIFSKNYAESHWCLKELCWMLTASHQPWFIPIFCDVEPWELRFIDKGCYAEAFQKHRERGSMELVDEWKEALGKAADISGKVFKGKEALGKAAGNSDTVFNWKESDDYGKLVRNIENTVMEHVKRDPLEIPPHPVGLDQAWKDLHDQIKKESFKKVVVIAGLGGIGKSTLARHIFNELSRSEFRRASYLFNVRETDNHDLQRQLCRDLLGKHNGTLLSWEGKTTLRKGLKGLKSLIVFDDVDQWDKIERVLDVHAVEEGSLIFVTSRDKDVVRPSYKNTSFVYDVQPLKNKHARELFCYHATRQSNSLEGCADLVEDFLKICGGLPLCLQVLGEQVSSNSDRAHWERQLKLYSQGASLPEANDVIKKLLK